MSSSIKQQADFWKQSAERNLDAAHILFKSKHYDFCLFLCHLALEKLLKGLAVKQTKKPAPYIHDLEKLAFVAKIKLTKEQISQLRTITTFNIAGRYDEAKYAFHKKCTKPFTTKHLETTEILFIWLKKEYQKK